MIIPLATIIAALLADAADELAPPGPTQTTTTGNWLVIVDVQPQYAAYLGFSVRELVEWAVANFDRVLYLYNGEICDLDEWELIDWIASELDHDYDLLHELKHKTTWYDKGYAFIRDWMDAGVDYNIIVGILRAMIYADINDVRDLPEHVLEHFEEAHVDPESNALFVPDVTSELQGWDGSVVCGGGEEECLAEVQILARALGVQLRPERRFIY